MSSYQTLPLFLAFAASSFGAASASPARSHLASRQECDTYTLNGTPGGFTMRNFTDFTTATAGGNLTAFLGLVFPSSVFTLTLTLTLTLIVFV